MQHSNSAGDGGSRRSLLVADLHLNGPTSGQRVLARSHHVVGQQVVREQVGVTVAVACVRRRPRAFIMVTRGHADVVEPHLACVVLEEQGDVHGSYLLGRVQDALNKLPLVCASAERQEVAVRPLVAIPVLQAEVHVDGVRVAALAIHVGCLGPARHVEGARPLGSVVAVGIHYAARDGLGMPGGVVKEEDLLHASLALAGGQALVVDVHRLSPGVGHGRVDADEAGGGVLVPHATAKPCLLVVRLLKPAVAQQVLVQLGQLHVAEQGLH
mmetsp:Transcript_24208/g.60608  ORF Transcript_24208/g.60608 Transcript_24208/m.60608 type:complete len:270 (+) Transcript_24208:2050-2859(+)